MEAVSNQLDIPELPLGGFVPGSSDVIQVRNIDGLGPVKAGIASTPYATGRGSLFQGSSIETRNIVLTLGLNPDWATQTITELRRLLYKYFMTGLWVRLRFISDDMPEVYINGIVESFEPNIFAQDPEIQVSVLCPKPDFIDEDTTLLTGTTLALPIDAFTDPILPWLNSLNYDDLDADPIDYVGTAPVGFELRVEETYTGLIVVVSATPTDVRYLYLVEVVVNSTQRFQMNTVRSQRYVYNVNPSTGAAVNILAKMTYESDWPEFSPGPTKIAVFAYGGDIDWSLGYLTRYGGL